MICDTYRHIINQDACDDVAYDHSKWGTERDQSEPKGLSLLRVCENSNPNWEIYAKEDLMINLRLTKNMCIPRRNRR